MQQLQKLQQIQQLQQLQQLQLLNQNPNLLLNEFQKLSLLNNNNQASQSNISQQQQQLLQMNQGLSSQNIDNFENNSLSHSNSNNSLNSQHQHQQSNRVKYSSNYFKGTNIDIDLDSLNESNNETDNDNNDNSSSSSNKIKNKNNNNKNRSNPHSTISDVYLYVGDKHYMPGTASLIEDVDKQLMVQLRDGKTLIGYLRSIDQFANLLLSNTIERVYVGNKYGEISRGVYIVRGENVVLIGEVDFTIPNKIEMIKVDYDEILELQKAEMNKGLELETNKKKAISNRFLLPQSDSILDDFY